ncbi:hypothetical protein SK128_016020 [Halocaridina rubra]|uniref:Uncharacterized protein n=1 Tax=Halocaridina rubra TaxID=373956 RepID=A0AAN8WFN2_HALRR
MSAKSSKVEEENDIAFWSGTKKKNKDKVRQDEALDYRLCIITTPGKLCSFPEL